MKTNPFKALADLITDNFVYNFNSELKFMVKSPVIFQLTIFAVNIGNFKITLEFLP